MSVFRQPWVLIFVALLAGYTYKVFSNAGSVQVGATQASAASEAATDDQSAKTQEPISVDLASSLKLAGVSGFSIEGSESMNVSFVKGLGPDLEMQLRGEGRRFLNQGHQFADWLRVTRGARGVVSIRPAYRNSNGVGKVDFWSNSDQLNLEVRVPQNVESLKALKINTVSGDILLSGLNAKSLKFGVVSGDITLSDGSAETVDIKSVSGDVSTDQFKVQVAKIKSVSGDVSLMGAADTPDYAIKTVSGDLQMDLQSPAKLGFKSLSGDLENQWAETQDSPLKGKVNFSSLSGDAIISQIK